MSANTNAIFTLSPQFPLDKTFLRDLLRIAVRDPLALPGWAENFVMKPEEEAIYFDEKEWRDLPTKPAPHRVDLYTILRGMVKVFDPKYDVGIATRQMVLRALYEQDAKPNILKMFPRAISGVIQLALFDQVIW
jgi:hypothetical protein